MEYPMSKAGNIEFDYGWDVEVDLQIIFTNNTGKKKPRLTHRPFG